MSYVIQVWDHPVPATPDEAESILERLLEQPAGKPSRKLDELMKTLWAKYPRDLVTDRSDPVWEDTFPKEGRAPMPVETLAVTTPYLDEVIPVIAAMSAALGLVAYDPQFGTVYLPGGGTLGAPPPRPRPAGGAIASEPSPRRLLDKAAAMARFVEKAGPALEAHGFRWKKLPMGHVFLRTFPGGQQIVAPVVVTRRGGLPGLAVLLTSNLFAVDEHVHRLRAPRNPKPTEVLSGDLDGWLQARGDARVETLYQGEVGERAIPVDTADKVDAAVAALVELVPELLAELHAVETLEGLWRFAVEGAHGRRQPRFKESIDAKLIAGKLVGARGLEEVLDLDTAQYLAGLEARRRARPDPDTQAMLAREQANSAERRSALLEFVRNEMPSA